VTTQPELLPDEVWIGRHPADGTLSVLGPECYIPPNENRVKYTRTPSPATHTQGEVEHSRERFESLHWEERCCFSTPDTITRSDYFMRGKLPSGWRYIDMYVELCWRSWCAALSMQPNTAEAHGDMVEQVTQCCQHNCSHPDATVAEQLGRTIKVGKQRIALPSHQPTEDAKEAYEEGWRNGNSHQGELEYPHMTMQYDWNVSNARALNRPVGGEK